MAVVISLAHCLAEVAAEEACFPPGHERDRVSCCYTASEVDRSSCFSGGFTYERCCEPAILPAGDQALEMYSGLGGFVADLRALRNRLATLAPGATSLAAATTAFFALRGAERVLMGVINATALAVADAWFTTSMPQAHFFFIGYFLAREAVGRWFPRAVRRPLRALESRIWELFAAFFRKGLGNADFCRCMEAGEFYSTVANQMRQAGIGSHRIQRALNGSTTEHQLLRQQQCRATPIEQFQFPGPLNLFFTTGCISGDLGIAVLLMEGCALEQDMVRYLMLQDTVYRFATLAAECHDSAFWSMTPREAPVEFARVLWGLSSRPGPVARLTRPALHRLFWAPWRRGADTVVARPWHHACGPHELKNVRLELRPVEAAQVHGPVCTEIGRFWLRLRAVPAAATGRTLAVIPVTYASWANPWHHLHWWIPSILHLKLRLRLDAASTDIALAFPNEDANFGRAVQTKARTTERSEPLEWSFLQHAWPRQMKSWKAWLPHGLHHDVLSWFSSRPARELQDYDGEAYGSIILGVPPMRFTVQSSPMSCADLSQVKAFVESTPGMGARRARAAQGGRRDVVTFIQRPPKEGRVIQNLTEVVATLQAHFGREVEVRVVRSLSGATWTEQYAMAAESTVLVAACGAGFAWLWAMRAGSAAVELRAANSPAWLPCSGRWGTDINEMMGGLAKLARVHHICVRSPAGATPLALSNLEKLERYDREMDVSLQPDVAHRFVKQALEHVRSGPPSCDGGKEKRARESTETGRERGERSQTSRYG